MDRYDTIDTASSAARQQMLYDANKKSVGLSYLLWFFLGCLGAHRFYLGQTGTAIVQLMLFIIGWATVIVGIGILLLGVLGIWVLIDAFLIPGLARDHNIRLADRITLR
jgi:TM2 domain-containing membrane protein YozV